MASNTRKIGVIICSTRKPRACPQITNFVVQTIQTYVREGTEPASAPTLHTIDLEELDLPIFNESGVPSQIFNHDEYDHEHTRKWSILVQGFDAFVFVVPQYNWGYPAVVKNAIDYLYNEWKGKPAMIVSYGGKGGGRCAAQLRQVLCGVRMIPTQKSVELAFPGRDILLQAASGHDLKLDGTSSSGIWSDQRKNIISAYSELVKLMSSNVSISE